MFTKNKFSAAFLTCFALSMLFVGYAVYADVTAPTLKEKTHAAAAGAFSGGITKSLLVMIDFNVHCNEKGYDYDKLVRTNERFERRLENLKDRYAQLEHNPESVLVGFDRASAKLHVDTDKYFQDLKYLCSGAGMFVDENDFDFHGWRWQAYSDFHESPEKASQRREERRKHNEDLNVKWRRSQFGIFQRCIDRATEQVHMKVEGLGGAMHPKTLEIKLRSIQASLRFLDSQIELQNGVAVELGLDPKPADIETRVMNEIQKLLNNS